MRFQTSFKLRQYWHDTKRAFANWFIMTFLFRLPVMLSPSQQPPCILQRIFSPTIAVWLISVHHTHRRHAICVFSSSFPALRFLRVCVWSVSATYISDWTVLPPAGVSVCYQIKLRLMPTRRRRKKRAGKLRHSPGGSRKSKGAL